MRKKALVRAMGLVAASGCLTTAALTHASSHREAPFITELPKVDNTDLYMFRSYEGVAEDGTGGRSGFVTILANVQPFQEPWGGPNYFSLDENAIYQIHIDNDGDAMPTSVTAFSLATSTATWPLTATRVTAKKL